MSKDLLFDIALEAHTMGRIYNSLGEPEGPVEFYEKLERMVTQKVEAAKPEQLKETIILMRGRLFRKKD